MSKKIFLIAVIFSVAGLLAEFTGYLPLDWINENFLFNLNNYLKTIRASMLGVQLYSYNFDSPFQLNYLNVALYVLLLAGALLYKRTNGKEMRLLRCLLAMILAFSAFSAFLAVFGILDVYDRFAGLALSGWLYYLTGLGVHIGVLILSFKAIKELTATRELDLIRTELENSYISTTMTDASKGDRFQNLLFDTIICLFTFFPGVVAVLYPFLRSIDSGDSERLVASLVFALSRVVYYIFFETLFASSPAKFLTETRVVDEEGMKPTSSTIIGRSWARIIPFDAFSFLGSSGWHDSLSQTRVINEKRTGVEGSYYYLVFPAILVLAGLIYFGNNYYEHYTYRQNRIRKHQHEIKGLQQELSRLSTDHMIKIETNDYSSDDLYLKVEKINGSTITAYVIKIKDRYFDNWQQIEQEYASQKRDSVGFNITFQRSKLDSLYTTDSEASIDGKWKRFAFMGDDKKYILEKVVRLYRPNLYRDGGGSRHGTVMSLDVINTGWPAYVTQVEVLEGSITWNKPEEPLFANSANTSYDEFSLSFTDYTGGFVKFKLTATDMTGRVFHYLGEGEDFDITLTPLD